MTDVPPTIPGQKCEEQQADYLSIHTITGLVIFIGSNYKWGIIKQISPYKTGEKKCVLRLEEILDFSVGFRSLFKATFLVCFDYS